MLSFRNVGSAFIVASMCLAQTAQNQPKSASIDTQLAAELLNAKRIYVDSFGDEEINRTLRAMTIDSLRSSKRYIVTENKDKADLILKGAALEKSNQEVHAIGSSTAVSEASGGSHGSLYGSGGVISGSSSGGFHSSSLGISDSQASVETVNDARLAVRLVSPDGDVVWSATQESKGGKYKGATADVADLVVKALSRELDRLQNTTTQ